MAEPGATYNDEDLVSEDPEEKNWKGICIALMVIATILSLIVTAIFLLTPGKAEPRVKNPRLDLEEVLLGSLEPKTFNGSWVSETDFVYQSEDSAILLYNGQTTLKTLLMANVTYKQWKVERYSLSADGKYILLLHDIEERYRYSYTARYHVYNVHNKYVFPLVPHEPTADIQYAVWGPTGNHMIYVFRNNVYYVPLMSPNSRPRVLTQTGIDDVIFNGIPDWLYEGEILKSNNAIWWSQNGTKICYGSFNDSDVEVVQYPFYGSYSDHNNIYPQAINLRYPKPGRAIPIASLWVVDLTKSDLYSQQVIPPDDYHHQDAYFSSVKWLDDNKLVVTWVKRAQNSSLLTFCSSASNWVCEKHLLEEVQSKGWLDMQSQAVFAPDGRHYFLRLPVPDGKAGHFKHLAMVDVETGRKDFLTFGQYDIHEVVAFQSETRSVFYFSTLPDKPGEKHLMSIRLVDRNITCLTCDEDEDCLYHNAIFSPGAKLFVLECLGPGTPRIELRDAIDNTIIDTLEENEALQDIIDKRALPQVRTFLVPLASGYKATVRLLLPPGLRDEEILKYPLVLNTNAEPGSQSVTEKFGIDWGSYLTSHRNFIYATIDGRGSANQGDKRLHEVYRRLGNVEVDDQLSVLNYLKTSLPFIDLERVIIWGWGYGAYVAALALAMDHSTIKCGISVAPISSWFYHDAAYTERYMQSPRADDNYIGYEKGDLLRRAEDFQDKEFFLIHGTADDQVHIQHSYMLMKSLTDAGIIFRTQIYPDERHHLTNVKIHLHRTMENFINYCFEPGEEEEENTTKD